MPKAKPELAVTADGVILPTRPARPTRVPPGPRKVAVLARRYAAGQELWHPGDAPADASTLEGERGTSRGMGARPRGGKRKR